MLYDAGLYQFMTDSYTPPYGRVSAADIMAAAAELGLTPLWGAQIRPGDLYMAGRNTGVTLLTCRSVDERRWVNPVEVAYAFDCGECVKVEEAPFPYPPQGLVKCGR